MRTQTSKQFFFNSKFAFFIKNFTTDRETNEVLNHIAQRKLLNINAESRIGSFKKSSSNHTKYSNDFSFANQINRAQNNLLNGSKLGHQSQLSNNGIINNSTIFKTEDQGNYKNSFDGRNRQPVVHHNVSDKVGEDKINLKKRLFIGQLNEETSDEDEVVEG